MTIEQIERLAAVAAEAIRWAAARQADVDTTGEVVGEDEQKEAA